MTQKKPLPDGLHRDTLAVRTALPASQWGENSEALYLTSGFIQPDAETMAHRFANPQKGYTYGRTSNPTVTSFEQRLAVMEGTEAAIGTSTGMAWKSFKNIIMVITNCLYHLILRLNILLNSISQD